MSAVATLVAKTETAFCARRAKVLRLCVCARLLDEPVTGEDFCETTFETIIWETFAPSPMGGELQCETNPAGA